MKKYIKPVFLACLLCLTGMLAVAQNLEPMKFTVNGKVKNGAKGEKVILAQSAANGSAIVIDSAMVANDGTFKLQGTEKDRGSFFTLNIAGRQKVVLLVEGGETFNVLADGTSKDAKGNGGGSEVTGSKNMEYYGKVDRLMQDFSKKVTVWNEEFAAAEEKKDTKKIAEIQQAYTKADQERLGVIRGLLPEMGTSLIALFTANNFLDPDTDLPLLKKLADSYDQVKPTPTLARAFIGQVKRTAGLAVGEQAPDFTLNDPEGKPLALSSLKGKYVLIDFWASWCGPCRMENPNVVRMYDKFKDKGFSIYGVSLDDNEKAWKTAIARDNLKWQHGSELKKWNSGVAQTYGVNAIPATFLLDRDGKIIAKNLRGPALESKLTELLGQ
ncbi:TlpA disulfide reductase family protein [Dyadobacter sandarakinus]|uniref:AhpC/TSA family protein n=1 Tax=Dyadobacter sandarakinus TaxID=2747268 RepID=A0ABX7IA99_9BACT|nr:TlpA disulfide reductase family protein [Dyadobacter sandarakinus]QRR03041.1 AhpC/TSA family protein [Dyadobacter sandarakinus]